MKSVNKNQIIIHTDGGARNNPGPAGIGIVIDFPNKSQLEINKYIGITTNNIAEYKAILEALLHIKKLLKNKTKSHILKFYSDSELIVRQLNGLYKIKNAQLLELNLQIKNLIPNFLQVNFFHIKREKNKQADKLVKQILKNLN